jgi:hypothetical protein
VWKRYQKQPWTPQYTPIILPHNHLYALKFKLFFCGSITMVINNPYKFPLHHHHGRRLLVTKHGKWKKTIYTCKKISGFGERHHMYEKLCHCRIWLPDGMDFNHPKLTMDHQNIISNGQYRYWMCTGAFALFNCYLMSIVGLIFIIKLI